VSLSRNGTSPFFQGGGKNFQKSITARFTNWLRTGKLYPLTSGAQPSDPGPTPTNPSPVPAVMVLLHQILVLLHRILVSLQQILVLLTSVLVLLHHTFRTSPAPPVLVLLQGISPAVPNPGHYLPDKIRGLVLFRHNEIR
jgi:hypothetical protein